MSPDPLDVRKERLLALLASYGRVAVAFSGGVDSSVVAKAARLACGDNAVAVTAVSASLAEGERETAAQVAAQIGIRHLFLDTDELANPDYLRNGSDRCYFCKTELYTQLEQLFESDSVDVIVNGANLDDRGDHRPGMRAASEHRIRSPLIETEMTKDDVRTLAREWDLPVWDKPASPCLSSRLAYGVSVTPERLRRVDLAEQFLRNELGLGELRVRHEANDLARIEVPVEALPRLLRDDVRGRLSARFHELGFRFVTLDLDGFRSGSLNSVLPLESLLTGGATRRAES